VRAREPIKSRLQFMIRPSNARQSSLYGEAINARRHRAERARLVRHAVSKDFRSPLRSTSNDRDLQPEPYLPRVFRNT
jgi:hypothetical protein